MNEVTTSLHELRFFCKLIYRCDGVSMPENICEQVCVGGRRKGLIRRGCKLISATLVSLSSRLARRALHSRLIGVDVDPGLRRRGRKYQARGTRPLASKEARRFVEETAKRWPEIGGKSVSCILSWRAPSHSYTVCSALQCSSRSSSRSSGSTDTDHGKMLLLHAPWLWLSSCTESELCV